MCSDDLHANVIIESSLRAQTRCSRRLILVHIYVHYTLEAHCLHRLGNIHKHYRGLATLVKIQWHNRLEEDPYGDSVRVSEMSTGFAGRAKTGEKGVRREIVHVVPACKQLHAMYRRRTRSDAARTRSEWARTRSDETRTRSGTTAPKRIPCLMLTSHAALAIFLVQLRPRLSRSSLGCGRS